MNSPKILIIKETLIVKWGPNKFSLKSKQSNVTYMDAKIKYT